VRVSFDCGVHLLLQPRIGQMDVDEAGAGNFNAPIGRPADTCRR
jgi:hypothetical protein